MDSTSWERMTMRRRMMTMKGIPPHPPAPVPPAAATEVVAVNEEDPVEMVPEQEASEAHEVVLAEAEPELS
jgi:hypothetical protein